MTTKITVFANHGWPVDVVPLDPENKWPVGDPVRVPAGETREFCVHTGQDLLIHEVQPAPVAEAASEAAA